VEPIRSIVPTFLYSNDVEYRTNSAANTITIFEISDFRYNLANVLYHLTYKAQNRLSILCDLTVLFIL